MSSGERAFVSCRYRSTWPLRLERPPAAPRGRNRYQRPTTSPPRKLNITANDPADIAVLFNPQSILSYCIARVYTSWRRRRYYCTARFASLPTSTHCSTQQFCICTGAVCATHTCVPFWQRRTPYVQHKSVSLTLFITTSTNRTALFASAFHIDRLCYTVLYISRHCRQRTKPVLNTNYIYISIRAYVLTSA